MNTNTTNILLRHNFIEVPSSDESSSKEDLATIMTNISYYGYALSVDAYRAVTKLSSIDLSAWWKDVELELKEITGDNRKIGDFVVYKNFPAEVLSKTESEYWIAQILMYWGFPNEFFTETIVPREKMKEQPKAKVLRKAKANTLKDIFISYLKAPARWKQQELSDVLCLSQELPVNLSKLVFKENFVSLASFLMEEGKAVNINTATDVLRLAAGLSGGDVSLRTPTKLKSFKNAQRRFLLLTLEKCNNLTEDVARRPELFKRLLHQLHPGDYANRFPKVVKVYDELYKDNLNTLNSEIENLLKNKLSSALDVLQSRPGEFRRRLVHTLDLFGTKAVKAFTDENVLNGLTTSQIVGLRTYLETVNDRSHRAFPPKGNWNKLQIGEVRPVDPKHVKAISKALGKQLAIRVPKVQVLDEATSKIKLPNNGEAGPYTRGTVFSIPEEVEFIRSASYWQNVSFGNTWFDNGWNFFDSDWKSMGCCSWLNVKYTNDAAIFSGDPTNSKDMKGKAAQLIDLYPSKLKNAGVRYAVWNILCFSRVPFSKATDVFAALQWGKDPQKGKLFEPSRCQLAFPLTGDQLTKYICVIDLDTREMTYIDANLHGQVRDAGINCESLAKNMPVFMEYIRSLPSVHDLFRESVDKRSQGAHILYTDRDTELKNVSAYVFRPENKDNKYKSVDINSILT